MEVPKAAMTTCAHWLIHAVNTSYICCMDGWMDGWMDRVTWTFMNQHANRHRLTYICIYTHVYAHVHIHIAGAANVYTLLELSS